MVRDALIISIAEECVLTFIGFLAVIFDKEPVHCPHAGECYCKQYGMCDRRDCDNEGCAGQYDLPKYSNLPEGWPMFGWNGEDRHWSGEL
jgi:hypothetical protein